MTDGMEAVVVSGVSGLASKNNPHSGFRLAWGRTKRASIMIPKNIIPLFSDFLKGIVREGCYSLERGERSLVGNGFPEIFHHVRKVLFRVRYNDTIASDVIKRSVYLFEIRCRLQGTSRA